ncbi:MAG: hypothetical protein P8R42_18920 [Candidatus Binatia bacterium]|nr:hypothetical protein [Candidatus Binatia bacterium]
MRDPEQPSRKTRTFEELLGAGVALAGALFVMASVLLSSTAMSGCGPCWPGPCADAETETDDSATPTPTDDPTPTPVGETQCELTRTTQPVDEDVWQSRAEGCPRIQLSADATRFDTDAFCESGLRVSGEGDAPFFRYTCNASGPWKLAVPVFDTQNPDELTLDLSCEGEIPQNQDYVNGIVLEGILFEENRNDIRDAVAAWEDMCFDAVEGTDAYTECAAVCAGDRTVREGLESLGMLDTLMPEVDCYLKLFDSFTDVIDADIPSTDGNVTGVSVCGCRPNAEYVDCLDSTPCFTGSEEYDGSCGATCWSANGTESGSCTTP